MTVCSDRDNKKNFFLLQFFQTYFFHKQKKKYLPECQLIQTFCWFIIISFLELTHFSAASRFGAILIPSSPGALHDLAQNNELAKVLNAFIHEKKPICAIGHGIAGLCSAKREGSQSWSFKSYSVTGPSVFESARSPDFSSLPLIIEDWIKDNGGTYSATEPDGMHVIIDRHLITGQNDTSTLSAVQNLILLCNARQGKTKS